MLYFSKKQIITSVINQLLPFEKDLILWRINQGYDVEIYRLNCICSIIASINKIITMNYLNPYQSRVGQMSSSSMFNHQPSDFKPSNSFTSKQNTLDIPGKRPQNQADTKPQNSLNVFPKALASKSMIDMNSTSSNRRVGFGTLASMARQVTPTFQQQSLQEKKSAQISPLTSQNQMTSGSLAPQNSPTKKFHQKFPVFEKPEEPVVPKKRRQSIDMSSLAMGIGMRKNNSCSQVLPFMRRMKAPEQNKVEQPEQQNNGENQRPKNFEFLKKRREATQPSEHSTTASMMHPSHSAKNIGQYSALHGGLKRPDFLNPQLSKFNSQFSSNVQCPEEKQTDSKFEINVVPPVSPMTPNFEFKKKKFYDSSVEPYSAKPSISEKKTTPPKKQILTMKERLAMKNQRQITLNDFQLLQKLGRGAFGDVYIAQEKHIGFICVIKKMSKKRIRDAKVEQHILREIKIQSYLNHANLTSYFGCFHDEDNLYLILEALPDGSLQSVKKKKKLPEKETAAIIKQVADGLKHMHEQYIIHRDLKPQNLFVNEGTIKIGDFGCSIYNRDSALRQTVVGCLEYSSPEQLSRGGYSDKIDAWSLGILTYELLFGKSPFESDIIKLTQNKQMKAELSALNFPASIPIKDETRKFIQNLLEADPTLRMDMDEVLRHPFLREEVNKRPADLHI